MPSVSAYEIQPTGCIVPCLDGSKRYLDSVAPQVDADGWNGRLLSARLVLRFETQQIRPRTQRGGIWVKPSKMQRLRLEIDYCVALLLLVVAPSQIEVALTPVSTTGSGQNIE